MRHPLSSVFIALCERVVADNEGVEVCQVVWRVLNRLEIDAKARIRDYVATAILGSLVVPES